MYKVLFTPFYYLMNLYVHNNEKFYFDKVRLGSDMNEDELEEIKSYRSSQFKDSQDYLIPKSYIEKMKDRRVDNYSYQFIARSKVDNSIIASMRLTPWPFESSDYVQTSDDYKEYLEISRLIVKEKGLGIGKKILIYAGNHAISKTNYTGFVAICKEDRLGMFASFGLLSKKIFKIQNRGDSPYHFISSSFFLISRSAVARFVRPRSVLRG